MKKNVLMVAGGLAVAVLCQVARASDLPANGQLAGGHHTNHFARAPYVQLATPNSIVVVWRSEGEIQPVVRYGSTPELLDKLVAANSIVTRVSLTTNKAALKRLEETKPELFRLPKLHSAPAGLFQYEARITGLVPETRYYYAVYDGNRRLTEPISANAIGPPWADV